jgi:hypothetical protein
MKSNDYSNSTIEELENDFWVEPLVFPTNLVKDIFLLRRKKISQLSPNDIRLLISQDVGLKFIIPIALKKLKSNILEETFYYPGDLLMAIMDVEKTFWDNNNYFKELTVKLLKDSYSELMRELDEMDEVDKDILNAVKKFTSSQPSDE